jgi:Carbohydrate-selective porin, OprB family/S-layer homology domain
MKNSTPRKAGLIASSHLRLVLLIPSIAVNCTVLPAIAQTEGFTLDKQIPTPSLASEVFELSSETLAAPTEARQTIESNSTEPSLIESSSIEANFNQAETRPNLIHLPIADLLSEDLPNPDHQSVQVEPISDESMPSLIDSDRPMSRVTSVTQLSDVQPTDWYFQSFQTLVERYGCIAGHPDSTFRGNQALSRYEFAAGLNSCIGRMQGLMASASADSVAQTDLVALEQLQREFAAELATFTWQVNTLEARTAKIEANQFSTTTKLSGLAWFNVNAATFSGPLRRETGERVALGSRERVIENAEEPNMTASYLVWLELVTSFTGSDRLVLQMATGNGVPIVNRLVSAGLEFSAAADFTNQGGGVLPNILYVRELFYQFPVSDNFQLVIAPRVNFFRYFDASRFSYDPSSKGEFIFNYHTFNSANSTLVNAIDRGTGVIALWNMSKQFELRTAYLGENDEYLPSPPFNSATDPSQGLFGGTNTLTAELTYRPSDSADVRFLYTRSNIQQIGGKIGVGGIGEPIYGIADDGFGGPLNNATADTFSLGFDWLITPGMGVFGRYSYGSLNVNPATPNLPNGEINVQAFQLGFSFPGLGTEGAVGTVSFVIPQDILSGREFLASGGGNGGTQYEIELSYYLPITDNISILPSFYIVGNPNNFSDNPALFVGNLRTQFSF